MDDLLFARAQLRFAKAAAALKRRMFANFSPEAEMEEDRGKATLVVEDDFHLVSIEKPGGRLEIALFGEGKTYGGGYTIESVIVDVNGHLKLKLKSDSAGLKEGFLKLKPIVISEIVASMGSALNRMGHHIDDIRVSKEQEDYEKKFPLGEIEEDNDNSTY